MQLGYTQAVEIAGGNIFTHTVNFIDHKFEGFIALPKQPDQGLVTDLQARATINHK